jgi:hypothetical protein
VSSLRQEMNYHSVIRLPLLQKNARFDGPLKELALYFNAEYAWLYTFEVARMHIFASQFFSLGSCRSTTKSLSLK